LVAVPRLPFALQQGTTGLQLGPAWRDTSLRLEMLPGPPIIDVLTGRTLDVTNGSVPLERLCPGFPFVLLKNED
jgi:hypothetical protein